MKNELAIKIYEVDYSFIIKNYLDKELWGKTWTLFVYKDYKFTLNLASIDTENNSIVFKIKSNKLNYDWAADVFCDCEIVIHNLSKSNVNILKRQINGAIFRAIENIERIDICNSEEYRKIEKSKGEEEAYLKNIAEEFLDKEKVKNEDIRSTYINEYVRRNSTIGKKKTDFKTYSHYNVLSDLYLVFCKAIKDEDREQLVLASIDENKINSVLNEVDTYMKELKTEENTENLKNELEEI